MKKNYTLDDKIDAFNRIAACMNDGYIDLSEIHDDVEFYVIAEALKLYRKQLKKENDQS